MKTGNQLAPKTANDLERSLADPGDALFSRRPAPTLTLTLTTVQAVHTMVRGVLGRIRGDRQPSHAARPAALLAERPIGSGRYLGRDQQHDVARGDDQRPGVERASRRAAAREQPAEVVQEQIHGRVAPAAAVAAVVAAAVEGGPSLAADALSRGALAVAPAVNQENARGGQTAAAAAAPARLGSRELVGSRCTTEGLIDLCMGVRVVCRGMLCAKAERNAVRTAQQISKKKCAAHIRTCHTYAHRSVGFLEKATRKTTRNSERMKHTKPQETRTSDLPDASRKVCRELTLPFIQCARRSDENGRHSHRLRSDQNK